MIQRFFFGLLLTVWSCTSVLPLRAADPAVAEKAASESQDKTTKPYHVIPGGQDGQIAFVTANLLQKMHYAQQPFDDAVSAKFFERYLESLDPQHVHFIQSDLSEFEHYRTNLNHLAKPRQRTIDTRPSCEIFERFVQRLQQRVAYADELLKNETFQFDTDERITINRRETPYPKNLEEAKALWRDRLRFEYLEQKLAKLDARKKAEKAKTSSSTPRVEGKAKSESEEIVDTLSHRYHRTLRTFTDWDNEDVLQIYLTTLAHVYDPHSDYFNHAQLESFAIGMNLMLFGIGAELVSEDGYCKIRKLLPGPAFKSKKIKENDRIIAVAQGKDQPFVDVVDMSLQKAVQLIRGPKGTEVRLKILPALGDSAAQEVSLIRDEIKLEDQAAKAKIIELPESAGKSLRLGVIDLPSFYARFDVSGGRSRELASREESSAPKSTTADVLQLLKKLKQENVSGVILDLRHNGGGSLEEAIKLTGLFIKEGPVVQVKNFDGKVDSDEDTDSSIAYGGPLIVLTSKFSASASEILAGALQDYGRALIVGDSSTHGKGTVQSVNMLNSYIPSPTNDPGALKLTIKKFYRPSGISTQLKGVVPDIILPSVFNESKEIGEASLDNPLPNDVLSNSPPFEKFNLVAPYVQQLRQHSGQRVSTEREYDYVREDIEHYKKLQADKTVSLNEKQRQKEKEQLEARQKARDKERKARKDPLEKVYEISLKQAELPGLPPPVQKTNSYAGQLGAGQTTNSESANATSSAETSVEIGSQDSDENRAPVPDASLIEAEHILVDYMAMLPKGDILTAGHKADSLLELNRKD
jgi:carboxyl-terminal processing protease